jgi:hypothetical protein
MYLEINSNNQVIGYSKNNNGVSIYTDLPIPSFTDTQILKFANNQFIVEDSTELLAQKQEEPLRLLRQQRNQLLQQSDWMAVSDRTMTQAQIDYRQSLRDLPETADPQLDENGNLTNVTWPTYE